MTRVSHRTFRDRSKRTWEVFEVRPGPRERRAAPDQPAPRAEPRRQADETRWLIADELSEGWLAFYCDGERRRVYPIPEGWCELDERELQTLLERATPGSPRARNRIAKTKA